MNWVQPLKGRQLIVLAAIVFPLLSGCGPSTKDDLKMVGVAYHGYHDRFRRGPSDWDSLIKNARNDRGIPIESLERIRDAGYSLKWDIEFQAVQGSTAETVLAELPDNKGGLRLMMDGSVKYQK